MTLYNENKSATIFPVPLLRSPANYRVAEPKRDNMLFKILQSIVRLHGRVVVYYVIWTKILWAFRICSVSKCQINSKVYRPVLVRLGRFWQICQFPDNDIFEVIVHCMDVTLVHEQQIAHIIISLTSNLYWG